MLDVRPPLHRRLFPWMLATVLCVLAAMSIWRFVALRHELYAQVETQLEAQITDRVVAWEDALLEELANELESTSANPAEAWLEEVRLRQRKPWFDSLYIWRPRRVETVRGRVREVAGEFLFPLRPPSERFDGVSQAACIRRSDLLTQMAVDPGAAVEGFVAGCSKEPLPVRLFAASQAADLLARTQGDYPGAIHTLDASGLDADTTLRAGIQQGLDPYRLVIQRLQRADYLMLQQDPELAHQALDRLFTTGLEITSLDAPEVERVVHYVQQPIVRELRHHGRDEQAARIERALLQAERRIRAHDEIEERILPRPPPHATEAARLIYDQYNQTPFLLFYGPVRGGEMGAALQLDQQMLVSDFLSTVRRYREHIVVTDASGNWVAGSRAGGPVAVQVPFSRSLTHLRVGLRQGAIDERLARLDDQWMIPMFIIFLCVILGLIALLSQVRADWRLQQLLVRQREFTARVTHELKTPLAGIKVMAENLENGAWHSREEQEEMARSIVREADRLAQRVEEILAVAKERKLPDPEPFDPEEPLLEAIDDWGPRLEHAGVRLEADLHATDQVLGDATAIRDAVACLLDNALKYRNTASAEPRVWLKLEQLGRDVLIDVLDNGLGVPPDMRDAIFDQFVRVEGPNRGFAGGHGLGLAQVREIVEAHRGTVRCEEGVDGGTRFVIALPALKQVRGAA